METAPLPSQILSSRLVELRALRRWSQVALADEVRKEGYSWDRSVIAKIETGQRQVTVDELIALAHALGVSPGALLVPTERTDVAVTPTVTANSAHFWGWLAGELPAPSAPKGTLYDAAEGGARARMHRESEPAFNTTAEDRLPGIRDLCHRAAAARRLAGAPDDVLHEVPDALIEDLEAMREDIAGLLRRARRLAKSTDGGRES